MFPVLTDCPPPVGGVTAVGIGWLGVAAGGDTGEPTTGGAVTGTCDGTVGGKKMAAKPTMAVMRAAMPVSKPGRVNHHPLADCMGPGL